MSEALLELLRPLGVCNAGNKGNTRSCNRKRKAPGKGVLLHGRNTAEDPGVTGASSRGPGKSGRQDAVTRVTPVTYASGHLHLEFEERAAVFEYDGGLSRFEAERSAAEALGYADPESLSVDAARRFVRVWGFAAAALALDEASLFGLVPLPPEGYTGLVPLLKGGRVTALTREVATVLAVDGASQLFALWSLNHEGQAVPFWELHPDDVICI